MLSTRLFITATLLFGQVLISTVALCSDALQTSDLYAHRLMMSPGAIPRISVGLAQGRQKVELRSDSAMRVTGFLPGQKKAQTYTLSPQASVHWQRGQAAHIRYALAVATLEGAQRSRRSQVLQLWRQRGERPFAQKVGLVLGLSSVVIDNRATLILIRRTGSRSKAEASALRIHDKYGINASVIPSLVSLPQSWIQIRSGEQKIFLQGTALFSSPNNQPIAVDKISEGPTKTPAWRKLPGDVAIAPDAQGLLAVVNLASIDAILKGVVPSEMFASAPLEALKAQAITARGAMFSQLGRRHFADPFSLCNNQHCQVYSGLKTYHPRSSQAVTQTRGELLFLAGKIVDSVYSSTCGGHSEDAEIVWDMQAKAALRGHRDGPQAALQLARRVRPFARSELSATVVDKTASDLSTAAKLRAYLKQKPNSYCARSSMVRASKLRWHKDISSAEMDRLMFRYGVGHVTDLQATGRGVSGRITGLRIIGDDGETIIQREWPVRQALGFLNSGAFVIDIEKNTAGQIMAFKFSSMGWGHGVGMCQVGAIGMAEAGLSKRDILRHYYNGAEIKKLY